MQRYNCRVVLMLIWIPPQQEMIKPPTSGGWKIWLHCYLPWFSSCVSLLRHNFYLFTPSHLFLVHSKKKITDFFFSAYPVVVYGPQPVRYGAPLGAYGAPPAAYGAPPAAYGAPPAGYGGPPAGYGAPPEGYGGPPERSEAPPVGYGAPPAGYLALPMGYRAPPPGYEALPVGYGAPPAGYGTPSAEYGAPPARNEPPSARCTAGTHNSVAAQPAGHEASLPSTLSAQAHLPSSKM